MSVIKNNMITAAHRPNDAEAAEAFRMIIEWLGEDPAREGLRETPARLVKAFKEYFDGYAESPEAVLKKTFREVQGYHAPVILNSIDFMSHCEHHFAPIIGKAYVAYKPRDRVVGLSKLARLVDVYARRLQIQERLTREIAQTLNNVLNPEGVAVMIKAEHFCLSGRGACKNHAEMVTFDFTGCYLDNPTERDFIMARFA